MSNDIFIFDESGTILLQVKDNSIRNITIPDGVTSIGAFAFSGCSCLESLTIPNSVKSIGIAAFLNCTSLTSIYIPNGVTLIGLGAFTRCTNLTSIAIPDSVTSIGSNVFSECIKLPIANSIRYADTCLVEVVHKNKSTYQIKDGTKFIGSGAFSGCTRLTSITIPNSVTTIGESAFAGCTRLTSITIPNSVTSIGEGVFRDCSNLLTINIPDSVTSIGKEAFVCCSRLTSITIPNSVTTIGESAFAGCTRLTSIKIPNSVTRFGQWAFSGCRELLVENSIRYADTYLVEAVDKNLSAYKIKDGTRYIGNHAFWGYSRLISIDIPDGVKSIGAWAFGGCSNLTSVHIPDSVTSIGTSAFEGCSMLTSIHIPNGVTSIGAFAGCTRLTSVTIGNSVKSIENGAFWGCPINRVNLPKATKYGNHSFDKITKVVKSKVFISYSWDDEVHKAWVEKLATDLNKYVHVIFDKWDLRPGNEMTHFMEQSVSQSNKVLCILTPNYKQKCDNRKGGSGFEYSLISNEILQDNPPSKFIPILRSGDFKKSSPISLSPKLGLDFSSNDPEIYNEMLEKLLSEIKEENLRPD